MVSLGGPPTKRKLRPGEKYWIPSFCEEKGNEFFCEVDDEFIEDQFNLVGLKQRVRHFQRALDIILDYDVIRLPMTDDEELSDCSDPDDILEEAAERLYGLIHARYILTDEGIDKMIEKWQKGVFGYCPRVYCEKQCVLPMGITDTTRQRKVILYCPKCQDVYKIRSSRHQYVDGAFFGTSFPQKLFIVYPELRPAPPSNAFVPSLYGFKIHPSAYELQYKAAREYRKRKRNSVCNKKHKREEEEKGEHKSPCCIKHKREGSIEEENGEPNSPRSIKRKREGSIEKENGEHNFPCSIKRKREDSIEEENGEHNSPCSIKHKREGSIEEENGEHNSPRSIKRKREGSIEKENGEHNSPCSIKHKREGSIEEEKGEHNSPRSIKHKREGSIEEENGEHNSPCSIKCKREDSIEEEKGEHNSPCSIKHKGEGSIEVENSEHNSTCSIKRNKEDSIEVEKTEH